MASMVWSIFGSLGETKKTRRHHERARVQGVAVVGLHERLVLALHPRAMILLVDLVADAQPMVRGWLGTTGCRRGAGLGRWPPST